MRPVSLSFLGVAISVGTVTALTGSIELTETAPTLATTTVPTTMLRLARTRRCKGYCPGKEQWAAER